MFIFVKEEKKIFAWVVRHYDSRCGWLDHFYLTDKNYPIWRENEVATVSAEEFAKEAVKVYGKEARCFPVYCDVKIN